MCYSVKSAKDKGGFAHSNSLFIIWFIGDGHVYVAVSVSSWLLGLVRVVGE
jgi:hypothetical protein